MDLMAEVDMDEITMRNVAKRAGVTAGLINYHFQTKENLINQVIRIKVNLVIDAFPEAYGKLEGEPLSKLRKMIEGTAGYLSENERISKISIISDYLDPDFEDNSMRTVRAYQNIANEIFSDSKTELERKLITILLISTGQALFLRSEIMKDFLGLDFSDKNDRKYLMNSLIDILISPDRK